MSELNSVTGLSSSSFSNFNDIKVYYEKFSEMKAEMEAEGLKVPESLSETVSVLQNLNKEENYLANMGNLLDALTKLGREFPAFNDTLTGKGTLSSLGKSATIRELMAERMKKQYGNISSDKLDMIMLVKKMLDDGGGIECLKELCDIMKLIRALGKTVPNDLLNHLEDALEDFLKRETANKGGLIDKLTFLNTVINLVTNVEKVIRTSAQSRKNEVEAEISKDESRKESLDKGAQVSEAEEVHAKPSDNIVQPTEKTDETTGDIINYKYNVEARRNIPFSEQTKVMETQENRTERITPVENTVLDPLKFNNNVIIQSKEDSDAGSEERISGIIDKLGKIYEKVEEIKEPLILELLDQVYNLYHGFLDNKLSEQQINLEKQLNVE
ncbi:hypothetical protein ACFLZV_05620 [Candidatus Margulisiibacteriota bacterium]